MASFERAIAHIEWDGVKYVAEKGQGLRIPNSQRNCTSCCTSGYLKIRTVDLTRIDANFRLQIWQNSPIAGIRI